MFKDYNRGQTKPRKHHPVKIGLNPFKKMYTFCQYFYLYLIGILNYIQVSISTLYHKNTLHGVLDPLNVEGECWRF